MSEHSLRFTIWRSNSVNLSHWVPPIGFGAELAQRVEIVCILSDNVAI
jgi:hypothetical protein